MRTRNQFYKGVLLLEYLTILWNVFEGIFAIAIGIFSGSLALLAFGLESSIEVFSSLVAVWKIKGRGNSRNKSSLNMISWALIVVAGYISFGTLNSLFSGSKPEPTLLGIVYMALVSVVMLVVGLSKRNLGRKLRDRVIVAESHMTLLDSFLSLSILCGLLLNAFLGWWWIDSVLAIAIAGNALRDGLMGLRKNSRKFRAAGVS